MNAQLLSIHSNSDLGFHVASAEFFPLRDDTKLLLFRPRRQASIAVALDSEGSYLFIGLAGEAVIQRGDTCSVLTPNKLHIFRHPGGADCRRIEFRSRNTLAMVAFVSPRWCLSCPRGPNCKVAEFLLRGSADAVLDQAFDLDDRGTAVARSLLDARLDADIDILSVEQSVLALLSWAFATGTSPINLCRPKVALSPQIAVKVRQAAEVLRQRFDDPPTISQLSALVGLNESDLKRCFKCLYGDSIASYSRRRRLDSARDLLAYSALGVAAVALEVGFANPSQFARAFRQQFGVNPAAYRRSGRADLLEYNHS